MILLTQSAWAVLVMPFHIQYKQFFCVCEVSVVWCVCRPGWRGHMWLWSSWPWCCCRGSAQSVQSIQTSINRYSTCQEFMPVHSANCQLAFKPKFAHVISQYYLDCMKQLIQLLRVVICNIKWCWTLTVMSSVFSTYFLCLSDPELATVAPNIWNHMVFYSICI